jgi:pentatricopeptide repeat protein
VQAALLYTTPDFSPGLPGLTKLISRFSREGCWQKALAIFESLPVLGLRADTTITNAAIAACGVGQDARSARQIFEGMSRHGIVPDTITYKAIVAALTRCGEWESCVKVRSNH